jgi:hypothetical protein
MFIVRQSSNHALAGFAMLDQMKASRLSGGNMIALSHGISPPLSSESLAVIQEAAAHGRVAEMHLLCVHGESHGQRLFRYLIWQCIDVLNATKEYAFLFVELSHAGLNGARLTLLQHTLENVFGFTLISPALETSSTALWYVCRLNAHSKLPAVNGGFLSHLTASARSAMVQHFIGHRGWDVMLMSSVFKQVPFAQMRLGSSPSSSSSSSDGGSCSPPTNCSRHGNDLVSRCKEFQELTQMTRDNQT